VITYIPGYAEYASLVRDEILVRKNSDFQIAVDLPHGLESQVLGAVKKLPEVSLIVDLLMRGIPVIPTSAPIEAVRSYLEYGLDIRFIDTSLPVTGNLDEYKHFVNACYLYGIKKVLGNPENYGISPGDLMKSWVSSISDSNYSVPYLHAPGIATYEGAQYTPEQTPSYVQSRLQFMAKSLKEMLGSGTEVLLICSSIHYSGILHYLDSDLPDVDDTIIVPSRICSVSEEDVLHLSREIPFMTYLYDLFRDTPVDRMGWLGTIYSTTESKALPAKDAYNAYRYSCKLAFTDQQFYPDIYNIVVAAKFVVDDSYGIAVFEKARSYPPNKGKESEFAITSVVDYDLQPLGEIRSLTLWGSLFGENSYRPRRWKKERERLYKSSYSQWSRTQESQKAERDFLRYITARFTSKEPSEDSFITQEYTCGLGEGFDVRETIRNWPTRTLYVKEPAMVNTACYVLDYRVFQEIRQSLSAQLSLKGNIVAPSEEQGFLWNIFFDKYYPWIGLARSKGNHNDTSVMVAFTKLLISPDLIFSGIQKSDPLKSAVKIGLKHARNVFVFTDSSKELVGLNVGPDRLKILPTGIIPRSIFEKMSQFDIAYAK